MRVNKKHRSPPTFSPPLPIEQGTKELITASLPASAKPRALARGLERSGYPTKPPGYAKGFAKASGEGGYALGYARLRRSESAGETRRRNIRYHGPWSMEFHIGARAPRRFRLGCRTDVSILVHKRNVKFCGCTSTQASARQTHGRLFDVFLINFLIL